MRARASLASLSALLCFAALAPAAGAECPNEAIREEQGPAVMALPDCMALEMVSPPKKFNQYARFPMISENGNRVRFESIAALADTPNLIRAFGDPYIATRTAAGWETAPTAPPVPEMTKGWQENGAAAGFSPDLSRWFHLSATPAQAQRAEMQAFQGGLGGVFTPLSPLMVPVAGILVHPRSPELAVKSSLLRGASADLSHLYFQIGPGVGENPSYLPGDPLTGGLSSEANAYVARLDSNGQPSLELLTHDNAGKAWGASCGATLGGDAPPGHGGRNQGALSPDGSRAYISTRPSQPVSGACEPVANKLRILQRIEGVLGTSIVPLFGSECNRVAPPCPGVGAGTLEGGTPLVKSVQTTRGAFLSGQAISGAGIPAGTTIAKVLSSSELELSANATASGAGVALTANDGDDRYQGASLDGTKVYFTTNRQLVSSDLDGGGAECDEKIAAAGCDLYLYDSSEPAGSRLIQVSAGEDILGKHDVGKEARTYAKVVAISTDGSHVYFVAQGVLTTRENPEGAEAEVGKPNLYLYQRDDAHPNGRLAFVGALNSQDQLELWGFSSAYSPPVLDEGADGGEPGGDGHLLVFASQAPLTADDKDGARRDVFRYDAESAPASLECVSCLGEDSAPFEVIKRSDTLRSAIPAFAEEKRWVSEDGQSVTFRTAEPLAPGDTDSEIDAYLWRRGEVYLLPGEPYANLVGAGNANSNDTPVVAVDGDEVAFQTFSQLLPQDGDVSPDVYVARAGGGFAQPMVPEPCEGEACQGTPNSSPASPSAASSSFAGPGNIVPTAACPPGKVRRKGRCAAKPHKRKRGHRRRQLNVDRRPAK